MKFKLLLLFLPLTVVSLHGQTYLNNLEKRLNDTQSDTSRVLALAKLSEYYGFIRQDSNIYFAHQALDIADRIHYPFGKCAVQRSLFWGYNSQGNYPQALALAFDNLKTSEQLTLHRLSSMALAHQYIGLANREMEDYTNAMMHLRLSIALQKVSGEPLEEYFSTYTSIAAIHLHFKHLDSALWYANIAHNISPQTALTPAMIGNIYEAMGRENLAKEFYTLGIKVAKDRNNVYLLARLYNNLANFYSRTGYPDSAIYYAGSSLSICQKYQFGEFALDASKVLMKSYDDKKKSDSALKYVKVMLAAKDSVFSQARTQQALLLDFDDKQRRQEIETAREKYRVQLRLYSLIGVIAVFIVIALILYRNNIHRRKTNLALNKQKQELEKTLAELKITQKQLIQSEKMASLGEITAGIAHEIQNPLNFINNFSEVNKELVQEAIQANASGQTKDLVEILSTIENNETKIIDHGRRADSIVKNMYRHSRESKGQKEPTDLNELANEYLRLSYQEFRSRNKSFAVAIKTNFDARLTKINIVRQDLGRVLLNLYNNAFFSVSEKMKSMPEGFEPAVTVSTGVTENRIEIRVEDNGTGIPTDILEKIFHPFFTTKDPGQGTGLGLSMSYDIIQAHGGEIKVETRQGEGAVFIIYIPLQHV